jgi:hypothetical protein
VDAYVRRILVNSGIDESRRPWRREEAGLEGLDPQAVPGPGSTLTGGQLENVTEQVDYTLTWRKGAASATVTVGVDAKTAVSTCTDQLSIIKTSCRPMTAPGGQKVMFGEEAMTYQGGPKYVMGGTYLQPDGDSAHVRILYPGNKLPPGAITIQQILTLLTDPQLDK